jgi:hypothetical protein
LKSCRYSARSQSPPHCSVTALAPETASSAPSLRRAYLHQAVNR